MTLSVLRQHRFAAALMEVLRGYGPDHNVTLLVGLHRTNGSSHLAETNQRARPLCVCDLEDGDPIRPGHLHLASLVAL